MDGGSTALKALAGVAMVILCVIYLRATWRAIGPIGLTLAAAFLGALIWVTIDLGLRDLERPTIVTWVLLFALATILAIGIVLSIRPVMTALQAVSDSRVISVSENLAQAEIEVIHSLNYDQVGLPGRTPDGSLVENREI